MRRICLTISLLVSAMTLAVCTVACDKGSGRDDGQNGNSDLATRNLERAMEIADAAASVYLSADFGLYKEYNPYTGELTDSGKENAYEGSTAFEAVADILYALHLQKESGNSTLYDQHFERYTKLLDQLYYGLSFHKGTFSLTSYTKTQQAWTIYGVPRASTPGTNDVSGTLNVYDDQMWLIRDFLIAYKATGDEKYLEEAEYLAEYCIDGYDCHIDENGEEYGGVTWGPGYMSKHSCSNGPFISPLVWLSDIYKGKGETATRYYIDPSDRKTRKTEEMDKSEYFLYYAKGVYKYQHDHLLNSEGVYEDNMNTPVPDYIVYETVDGKVYRGHNDLTTCNTPPYSYNSGAILSGAVDLYLATGDSQYLADLTALTDASFKYFARLGATVDGLYTYDFSGNNTLFNSVLLRGYIDAYPVYSGAALPVDSFQQIFDHAYDSYAYEGFLPNSLYLGWANISENRKVKGKDQFIYAAQFALLAQYCIENN